MPTRNELQKTCDLYVTAYQTGDAHGCAAVFLSDAKMMSPYGPTACGREEIEAQHAEWTGEGGEGKRLEIVEFGGSDNVAWALAKFGEGKATGEGTSLCVFDRQSDGRWLIRMCSLNASTPPAE
jgi:uncharacterized protein (TIGR02246 family)